ncbi:MAG TPA: alpha/beta hydrolase [Candidatus Saccharimonadales bacterium]|jgi:pimeloyl-ACP methyl ester carboxylesterase
MQSKSINLVNGQLTGEWHYNDSHAKKHLVILCHGYRSSHQNSTIVAISKGLNKRGHDTFTFNFSTNTGGFDIEHQVKDIAKLVEHFKGYGEIILLAGSFGALTAAIATLEIPKIKGLITLNGFFGHSQLGEDHRRNYIKFRIAALVIPKYRRIWRYFRHRVRPELIKVPVLVIHSEVDKYVFIRQSRDFYDKLKAPKQFIELQTANHGVTSSADRQRIISEIDKWLA